jgi:hypothetical protein
MPKQILIWLPILNVIAVLVMASLAMDGGLALTVNLVRFPFYLIIWWLLPRKKKESYWRLAILVPWLLLTVA